MSAQGVDEHAINVHYYYFNSSNRMLPSVINLALKKTIMEVFTKWCMSCNGIPLKKNHQLKKNTGVGVRVGETGLA